MAGDSPGLWVARCRFRDRDGKTRQLRKHGANKTAARSALHEVIQQRQRSSGGSRACGLTPSSTLREAAALHLKRIERRREDSTHALYAFDLESTILPAL